MNSIAAKVSQAIHNAIEADRLVLPTMPETALKVREVADNPEASPKDLANVISGDTALTARIIKIANSAMFRGTQQIDDIHTALSRLGMATAGNLAIGLAMEQMFQATTDMVDKRLRQVWSLSAEVAGQCSVLCRHFSRLNPDQATLAGLTHKIGILPILSYAEDHPALLKDSFTLDAIIAETHPAIGEKILTDWEFPMEIRKVPSAHLNLSREAPSADYADLVTVAAMQAQPFAFGDIDPATVTAYQRLGINPDTDLAEGTPLREEMASAAASFR